MTTSFEPSIDDVLHELAALPEPPSASALRVWLNRFPKFKREIIEFVTDWLEMEALGREFPITQEDIDQVVNLTMSEVQRQLDTLDDAEKRRRCYEHRSLPE